MDINEVIDFSKSDSEVLLQLKRKYVKVPQWSDSINEYESKFHDIMDRNKRPDKVKTGQRVEEVSRIRLDLEKLITARMVEFMFSVPVRRVYNGIDDDEEKQKIADTIEKIYTRNRIDSENIKRSREFFAACEVCTQWYSVDKKNSLYGFDSEKKISTKTFSPMSGYELYPLFDEYDDMLAMSIEYNVVNYDGSTDTYFETYTDNRHMKWKNGGKVLDEENKLGKIPFVYMYRNRPIWEGVQHIIKEIEWTLSRNSDVIAYNASPVLAVTGEIRGAEKKGEEQRIFRLENGGNVAYVSWNQAIEAIKFQIDTLLRLMWMQIQLPDLSFENIKGLGAVSGEARRTLLTDAHLKVGDEKGVFLEYFDREANIIKAFVAKLQPSWAKKVQDIEIEHVITPFVQNDEMNEIEKWIKANGGKPIVSQLDAIKLLGVSSNPRETYNQIREEAAEEAQSSLNNIFQGEE